MTTQQATNTELAAPIAVTRCGGISAPQAAEAAPRDYSADGSSGPKGKSPPCPKGTSPPSWSIPVQSTTPSMTISSTLQAIRVDGPAPAQTGVTRRGVRVDLPVAAIEASQVAGLESSPQGAVPVGQETVDAVVLVASEGSDGLPLGAVEAEQAAARRGIVWVSGRDRHPDRAVGRDLEIPAPFAVLGWTRHPLIADPTPAEVAEAIPDGLGRPRIGAQVLHAGVYRGHRLGWCLNTVGPLARSSGSRMGTTATTSGAMTKRLIIPDHSDRPLSPRTEGPVAYRGCSVMSRAGRPRENQT